MVGSRNVALSCGAGTVQAWTRPAGLPEEDPRLEGMGLLMFHLPPRPEAQKTAGPCMSHAD